MNIRFYIIFATCLFTISVGSAVAQTEEQPLEGTIQVGALIPITGGGSNHGQDVRVTLDLAEKEINQYLQEQEASWKFELITEDTQTSPVLALESIEAIKAHGVDLVIGPYSSAELRNVMGYATSNDMLLISYASMATTLAIPGDNIFRFVPDASHHAPVNARIFEEMGITHVIPVWRGDAWGDDMAENTKKDFEMNGGTFHDGIRYNPEAIEFSSEIALLSDQVEKLSETVDRDKIGILLLTFSEGVHIAQYTYQYENLFGLEWVGIDTLVNVGGEKSDRISSEFYDSQISISLLSPSENPTYDMISEHVFEMSGRQPIIYSISAYEAAWVLALSIYAANSTDSNLVAAAMQGVLEERDGALGKIVLNEAGDLASSNYVIWQLKNNKWIHTGNYTSETDIITWNDNAFGMMGMVDGDEMASSVDDKINDAGIMDNTKEGGGCLIATAAFGSELAPQIQSLRQVRSDILQTNTGTSFMEWFNTFYYSFSPEIADLEREISEICWLVRTAITPAVHILGIMSIADPDSEISVAVLGTITILALAGLYVILPVLVAWVIQSRLYSTHKLLRR